MILAIVLSLLTFAFGAYFLHLFFQLNRAERKLQATLTDVEASMLNRYGRPRPPSEEGEEEEERKPATVNKKA